MVAEQSQKGLNVPIGPGNFQANQILGGVHPTNSFHSSSSGESAAEMAQYFPDAQTSNVTSYR